MAYGDVEDALTDLHSLTPRWIASENGTRLRKLPALAEVQYRTGLVDYLIVIDAERTLARESTGAEPSDNFQMSASIHLVKALGGGWQEQP